MKPSHFRFRGQVQHPGEPPSYPASWLGCRRFMNASGGVRLRNCLNPQYGLRTAGSLFLPGSAAWRRDEAASLARLEDTRHIFQKEDGKYYDQGDIFRQPQLAQTLKQIASQGAQYMYRGAWAHRFVDAVQREGGKITLQDIADYRPLWSEPIRAMYHGYEVTSLGSPSLGGPWDVECFAARRVSQDEQPRRLLAFGRWIVCADPDRKACDRTDICSRRRPAEGLSLTSILL